MSTQRRSVVLVILAMVVVLVLAGCTPNQNPQPIKVKSASAVVATTAPPASQPAVVPVATAKPAVSQATVAPAKFNVADCAKVDAKGLPLNEASSILSNQCVWSSPVPTVITVTVPITVVVTATPVPPAVVVPTVAPTRTQQLVLGQMALGVLAEVDQTTKVEQSGPGYRTFNFVTDPGQVASAALIFLVPGELTDMRIVCDDVCNRFYLVTTEGVVKEIKPFKSYGANFDFSKVSKEERAVAVSFGINVEKGEILAQNLFRGPFKIATGDQLVIYGADDPQKAEFRGIFASWWLNPLK